MYLIRPFSLSDKVFAHSVADRAQPVRPNQYAAVAIKTRGFKAPATGKQSGTSHCAARLARLALLYFF
jgi:hypothetical protein